MPGQNNYFAAGAAVFLLEEFFLRNANARRFRCVRRSRFFSERRASSTLASLWLVSFAATFFFSLVSSDSFVVFFAIRIRASLYISSIALTAVPSGIWQFSRELHTLSTGAACGPIVQR